jgi:hypothetical protein
MARANLYKSEWLATNTNTHIWSNFYKVNLGLKGGILIDADSGPCTHLDAAVVSIQIGPDHTVFCNSHYNQLIF